jgi:hypothetical protein
MNRREFICILGGKSPSKQTKSPKRVSSPKPATLARRAASPKPHTVSRTPSTRFSNGVGRSAPGSPDSVQVQT